MRKVSALSEKEVGEKRQKLAALLKIKNDDLTAEEAQHILDCALQYHDLFAVNPMERGEVQEVTHVVDTGEEPPIRRMSRRVPFALRKETSNMVKDMLAAGI